jgi:hypothetical protein
MVRNAVTVAGVTANWNSAYTPIVTMMSWMTATIADRHLQLEAERQIQREQMKK